MGYILQSYNFIVEYRRVFDTINLQSEICLFQILEMFYLRMGWDGMGWDGWMDGRGIKSEFQFTSHFVRRYIEHVYPNCANYDDAIFCNVKSRKS